MGAFDWLKSKQKTGAESVKFNTLSDGSFWTYYNVGKFQSPDVMTMDNGYQIASSLGEVFFCVDTIAEKVAKLFDTIHLQRANGEEVKMPANIARLMKKPNIYDESFTDLIYNFVFSELSDGNGYMYFKCPEDTKKITKDNVQAILTMQPDKVKIELRQMGKNYLKASTIEEYVNFYQYEATGDKYIKPMFVLHSKSYMKNRSNSDYRGLSPLYSVKRNIDNLLAVYSARYNVYVKNGTAYILFPKVTNAQQQMQTILNSSVRDDIIVDMNSRHGLTGDKQIKAISTTPLEGINTLVGIKDLMPLEESEANFLIIAGALGIDKDLLPLKGGTTFTNKEVAEAKIWTDIAVTYAQDICNDLTNMFNLAGEKFAVRTDGVGFLQSNRKTQLEADKVLIENLKSLQEAGLNTNEIMNKILTGYEQ